MNIQTQVRPIANGFDSSTTSRNDGPLARLFREEGKIIEHSGAKPLAPAVLRDGICALERGWITRRRDAGETRQQIVDIHVPGDFFNFQALGKRTGHEELYAASPARLRWIDSETVQARLEDDQELALEVIRLLANTTGWAGRILSMLGQLAAYEATLTLIAHMRRHLVAAGNLKASATRMPFPFSQTELGSMIGITPVHMNRVSRRIREERLALIRARMIWFDELDRFEQATKGLMRSETAA
jgi:CRP-like cAMP-binding protein